MKIDKVIKHLLKVTTSTVYKKYMVSTLALLKGLKLLVFSPRPGVSKIRFTNFGYPSLI